VIRWRLAMRLLLRNWRSGEQRILVAALVIAVSASTAIGFFTDRLGRGMANQSADFLGADLALLSPRPVDAAWIDRARASGLQAVETLEFASVVVGGDELLLSSVKAVQDGFPLRGEIRTAAAPFAADAAANDLPRPGEAWVAPRLLTALGVQVGDTVEVGALAVTVTRVITFEPGQVGDPFGIAPRLLMRMADVPATGVVQPGSRLSYQYLFAGREADVAQFRGWLEAHLGPSHELVGVKEGRRAVGSALERAERYLGLSVLAAIVLAGVAVAMAARRYSERHFDMSAMLRCMGASQRDLLGLYLPQLLVLGLAASAAGCVLGWLAQYGLLFLLADLLPATPSAPHAWPLLAGFATLLHRYAGTDDLIIGTPSSNRGRAEVTGLIGLFMDLLVIRADLAGDPTFDALTARLRDASLEAFAHGDVPFGHLVSALGVERDPAYNPLCQVLFSYFDYGDEERDWGGLSLSPIQVERGTIDFDLFLTVIAGGGRLRMTLEYNLDLFEPATAERMARHLRTLLRAAVERPETPVSLLPLMDEGEARESVRAGVERKAPPAESALPESLVERLRKAAAARGGAR